MRLSDQDVVGQSDCMRCGTGTHAGTRCEHRLQEQVSGPTSGGCTCERQERRASDLQPRRPLRPSISRLGCLEPHRNIREGDLPLWTEEYIKIGEQVGLRAELLRIDAALT